MKRRLLSLLLAMVMVLGLLPPTALADTGLGTVQVIVENTTYSKTDGAPWDGTLVDTDVALTADSTMMSCIGEALNGYNTEGLDSGYISSINGLAAFDGGSESGWMGTLNDWFVNAGFNSFTVADGTLCAGDVIRVMYTCVGYGADLGGEFGTNKGYLSALSASTGSLSPAFDKDTPAYTLTVPSGVDTVDITATAENKNDKVTVSVGGTEYRRGKSVPVADGAQISVACGVKTYSVTVAQENAPQPMVNVDFTMQEGGAFLLAPQFHVAVSGDLAEQYGYADSVTDGVSALDVLVKAHALKYPGFAENPQEYLVVNESGFLTTVFGAADSNFGYMVNGEMPNDGVLKDDEYAPGGKSYTGYGIAQCPVEDDDALEFFRYQDSYYLDNYGWAEYQGSRTSAITVRPDSAVSLTYKGFCVAYYGCVPMEALESFIELIEGAQLAWVSTETGALTDIQGAVTGEDGKAAFTAPTAEGTYYLTAYIPAADIENYATPLVMSLVKVVVDPDAPQPEAPEASAALTALSVADLDSNPNALELKPAFSSDVTDYSVEPVNFQKYAKMAYVKATAASETAEIKAALNGTEKAVTSADTYWTAFSNMQPGQDNVLTVTVTDGDLSKTYTVTIPMKAETISVSGISLDKTELTLTAGETAVLTATVEPDNATDKTVTWTSSDETVATVDNGTVTAVAAGTATITAKAGEKSATCAVTVQAPLPDASITVPGDATIFVGEKTGGKHYVPFTEKPAAATVNNADGTVTYYYDLTTNSQYNYRISGEGYVTYAGVFKKTADYSLTVTQADLQPEGKTSKTVDHDVTSNNGYNVADIYLNINAQNYLKLAQVGDTYQLVNLRNWETVNTTTANYFIEPDYHYTVLNENGQADSSVVTVSDSGLITANQTGTAIVLVTYDAINVVSAAGGPFFGAIWPENTGVFVVSVGAQDSGITTGMTINEAINEGKSFKNDGTALDAEHDVIYFLGESGSYTFTPGTEGVTVTVANPTVGEAMTFSGFTGEGVTTEDGAVTVPLKEGRNIVKLEKDGKAEYQVITAKQLTVTINDGNPVKPGDTVSIKFSTVYHPINKLAGVYNYTPAIVYTQVEGCEGQMVGSKGSQYQFAAAEAAQTVSWFMTTKEQWGATMLSTGAAFTIPEDYTGTTLTISGGTIGFGGWGSWAGEHRRITLEEGKLPNLNAASPFGYLGQLPDLVIPVEQPEIDVTLSGLHNAQVSSLKLYSYTDGVKGETDLLNGVEAVDSAYTVSLAAGDYWVEGYDANEDCNGGLKLTVSEESSTFKIQRMYQIYATNSGWVKDTDYTIDVTVTDVDGNARTIELGQANNYGTMRTSCLFVVGDTVEAVFTPIGDKTGYLPITAKKTPTMNDYLSASIPQAYEITITAPAGSTIAAGTFGTYYIYTFAESTVTEDENGVTAVFRVPQTSGNHFYRVQNPDGVTYWNFAKWTADAAVNVTAEDLCIGSAAFTPQTIYRFDQNVYDMANLYLNANGKGYLDLDVGEDFELNVFRNWMAIESFMNAKVGLPDVHYTVIDVNGNPSNLLTITPDENNSCVATMTANRVGTAIVLVTYDAMTSAPAMGGSRFSAIWPECTGVIVVTVGADGSSIQTNMTMDRLDAATTALDAEHDILFYLGDAGASYSFKPEDGCTVTVNRSVVTDKMTFGGFTNAGVTVAEDGTVTVSGLTTGRHIIKVQKGGVATYQVVTARGVSYVLQDKDGNALAEDAEIRAGDTIKVQFTGLLSPAEKLSGVYNHNFSLYYFGEDETSFRSDPGGSYGVYDFSGNPVRQNITITIPKYWNGDSYTLHGAIKLGGFAAAPIGGHREVRYATGKPMSHTATSAGMILSRLPELTINLAKTDFVGGKLTFVDGENKTVARTALTVNLTDSDGNKIIVADDGSFPCVAGKYTYTIYGAGYRYKTGSFSVGEDDTAVSKRIKLVNSSEGAWDGVTTTEPEKDQNGVYLIDTGAKLAWLSKQVEEKAFTTFSAKLTDDIDLGDYPWTAINTSSFSYVFTLDGANHEIRGLNAVKGLFGTVGGASEIKDLTVSGVLNTANGSVGTIVGYLQSGKIQNCVSRVAIKAAGSNNSIGGIAGYMGNAKIINCVNQGTITAEGAQVGGIVGSMVNNAAEVSGCYNTGAVLAASEVGGILGSSNYTGTVSNCYNTGAITGSGENVGGVIGQSAGSASSCYNVGTVTGGKGFAGSVGNADRCYALSEDDAAQVLDETAMKSADLNSDAFAPTCGGYPALLWQTGVTFHAPASEAQSVTAPTCTEKGYSTYLCTKCEESYRTTYTAPLGHDFCKHEGAPESCNDCVYTAPGCETEGSIVHTCRRDGCDVTKTDVIPATGHTPLEGSIQTFPAYQTYTCAVCGTQNIVEWNDPRLAYVTLTGTGISAITMEDEGSYPWTYNEQTARMESSNKGVRSSSSTTKIIFTLTAAGTLRFDYGVSSETNYDKLTISLGEEKLANGISGETTGSFEEALEPGTYRLTLSYAKDTSGDSNGDIGWISGLSVETETVEPEPAVTLDEMYDASAETLRSTEVSTGSVKGEWLMFGLARALDKDPTETQKTDYLAAVKSYIESKINDAGQLHRYKSTDNSRIALALTALGYDPADFEGYDLLKAFGNTNWATQQGSTGTAFALLALRAADYTVSNEQELIDSLLNSQNADGGWAITTGSSDLDATAMVIQALAPDYENARVETAVNNALAFLAGKMQEDGTVTDGAFPASAETIAQILVALTELGRNPASDTQFIKNGKTLLDGLTTFYLKDQGFAHTQDGEFNQMATEQAFYALVACRRLAAEQRSLYDMSVTRVTRYTVTVAPTANGRVSVDLTRAAEGAAVTVTAEPDIGYELESLTVTDTYGKSVPLTGNTFTMPAADVTVTAVFAKAENPAADVEAAIDALTVTKADARTQAALEAVEEAYRALTDEQKANVKNADKLIALRQTFDRLLASAKEAAKEDLKTWFGTLEEEDYTKENWNKLRDLLNDGLADIDKAKNTDEIDAILRSVKRSAEDIAKGEKLTITFRLIGDTRHNNGVTGHEKYVTWIPTTTYTLEPGATVYDVFMEAIADNGLSQKGASGNYVSSIKAPAVLGGYWLGEFDNGKNSGWMYTVNGVHPGVGLKDCILKDGDRIVWHYVDDYTKEESKFTWLEAEDISPEAYAKKQEQTVSAEFTDVTKNDWFYDDVQFVVENGLFNGTSNTTFSPNAAMNRAMLVTVLYRLEGEPKVSGSSEFTDVAANQWYTDAVIWATGHKIVNGYGNGKFGPTDSITREQMAAILYRYAQYKNYSVKASNSLMHYDDYAQITPYALQALKWANAEGLINGRTGTTLAPQGTATRAEVAAILHRFVKNVVKAG